MDKNKPTALIIGAGPSGLALAYELIQLNSDIRPVIIDKLPQVGGLSRTIYDDKSGIDLGGHRLFTKDKYVESIWKRFLKEQNAPALDDIHANRNLKFQKTGADPNFKDDVLLLRKRFSSVIKDKKKINYPIRFNPDTFKKLGFASSSQALLSYLKALVFKRNEKNFEDFLINKFGRYLYNLYFKEHSKKVWGVEASELVNEWGRERIQKSLFSANKIWEDEYYYPKYGCSQLWDKMAQYIIDNGGDIILNCEFLNFEIKQDNIISAKVKCPNLISDISANYFISSIPISDIIKSVEAPFDIKQNALNLPYRDYILVSLYTTKFNLKNTTKYPTLNDVTPDNWIYLQEKNTIASRLQIMNNWSPYLVEDFKNKYLVSLEYFCNKNDDLWNLSDDEITKLALSECEKYGFFDRYDIYKTKVIRELKAYPVYSGTYKYINKIKNHLKTYKNLYLMGRCGEHKYINMDLAMVCGINIARDINKGYVNEK
ncbi:MAG: NAD(P)-binding protein [Candidatus Gastranaerophilales bacterium]|nr:NAD(P)-binding protein [Candidatus Gastranaerophilales bacterium]